MLRFRIILIVFIISFLSNNSFSQRLDIESFDKYKDDSSLVLQIEKQSYNTFELRNVYKSGTTSKYNDITYISFYNKEYEYIAETKGYFTSHAIYRAEKFSVTIPDTAIVHLFLSDSASFKIGEDRFPIPDRLMIKNETNDWDKEEIIENIKKPYISLSSNNGYASVLPMHHSLTKLFFFESDIYMYIDKNFSNYSLIFSRKGIEHPIENIILKSNGNEFQPTHINSDVDAYFNFEFTFEKLATILEGEASINVYYLDDYLPYTGELSRLLLIQLNELRRESEISTILDKRRFNF